MLCSFKQFYWYKSRTTGLKMIDPEMWLFGGVTNKVVEIADKQD